MLALAVAGWSLGAEIGGFLPSPRSTQLIHFSSGFCCWCCCWLTKLRQRPVINGTDSNRFVAVTTRSAPAGLVGWLLSCLAGSHARPLARLDDRGAVASFESLLLVGLARVTIHMQKTI